MGVPSIVNTKVRKNKISLSYATHILIQKSIGWKIKPEKSDVTAFILIYRDNKSKFAVSIDKKNKLMKEQRRVTLRYFISILFFENFHHIKKISRNLKFSIF